MHVCVCVCVHACVRVCVRVCDTYFLLITTLHVLINPLSWTGHYSGSLVTNPYCGLNGEVA